MTPEGLRKKEKSLAEVVEQSREVENVKSCTRCGGLMVFDYCTDIQDDTRTISFLRNNRERRIM